MERGFIQIYTGEGKGKTTSALGALLRARGHDFRIVFVGFFKDPEHSSGEIKALKELGINCHSFALHHPHFYKGASFDEVRASCLDGLKFLEMLFGEDEYDLIVVDEFNIALRDGFLKEEEVMEVLDKRPPGLELILTGRGAPVWLVKRADLVSEILQIKHPFDHGIQGREGIEY